MPDPNQTIDPSFLEQRHPDYDERVGRWNYVRDHYDDQRIYDELDTYLPKKRQAEHPEAYAERQALAQYPNLLGPTLDSFVGLLFHKEAEAEREWGGLGDPEDEDSWAGLIAGDADGAGTDHEAQLKLLATSLLEYQKVGVLVDTTKGEEDGDITQSEARERGIRPFWKVIDPQAITNWRDARSGQVVEALVREVADSRESLTDPVESASEERWLWMDLDGFLRLRNSEDGVEVVGQGTWNYTDAHGQRTLPLFIAELPLNRYPAFTLAKQNNAIFNGMSELRWLLRSGGVGNLFVYSGGESDFEKFVENVKKGARAIHERLSSEEGGGGHRFVSPDMAPASSMLELKEKMVTDFWRQALYEFSDRSVQRTATEITAEFVSSIGAFLNILAGAVDEAENVTLRLLEQAAGVTAGQAMVRRTRSFGVQDGLEVAKRIKGLLFGEMSELPMGPRMSAKAAEEVAKLAGVLDGEDSEELVDELKREAELREDRRALLSESRDAGREEPPTVAETREEVQNERRAERASEDAA